MFQFGLNQASRFQFRSVPRWQIAILSVLGISLAVILAIFVLGAMLIIVPVVVIGGMLTRWFWKLNTRSKSPETTYSAHSEPTAPASSGVVIDAEYRVIDSKNRSGE